MKKLLSFAVMALALASCTKEIDSNGGENGPAAMEFSVKTAQGSIVTYADIATTPEMTVTTFDIFLFDATSGALIGSTANLPFANEKFTADPAWLTSQAGKKANVYFVGNNTTANLFGEASQTGTPTTEAAFKEQLTIAQDVVSAGTPELLEAPLLFTAVLQNIQIPAAGKVTESVTLKRREARFDIVNPDGMLDIQKVIVTKANIQGPLFSVATGTNTPAQGSLDIDCTSLSYNAEDLAESVFYLYPTQLGVGNTEIAIVAEMGGVDRILAVNSTAMIDANKRYKLVFDPAELEFIVLEIPDYTEADDELPAELVNAVTIAGITGGAGTLSGSTYYLAGSETLTVTLNVPTLAGTTAAVTAVSGGTIATATETVATALTYAIGYQQTYEIDITYPSPVAGTENVVTFTVAGDASIKFELTLAQKFEYYVGDYYPTPGDAATATGIVYYVDPSSEGLHGLMIAVDLVSVIKSDWKIGLPGHGAVDNVGGLLLMQGFYTSDPSFDATPGLKPIAALNDAAAYSTGTGLWFVPTPNDWRAAVAALLTPSGGENEYTEGSLNTLATKVSAAGSDVFTTAITGSDYSFGTLFGGNNEEDGFSTLFQFKPKGGGIIGLNVGLDWVDNGVKAILPFGTF